MIKYVNIELIEDRRKKKGYSLQQMSELLGYKGRCTYNNKKLGFRGFSIEDIVKLAYILDISVNDIIGGDDNIC